MVRVPPFRQAALLLGFAALAGCSSKSPVQPSRPADPIQDRQLAPAVAADARVLVEANNRFAIDIYSRLRRDPGNLFVSPYSMSTAFAMAYAGAAGQTRDEMARVFHFTLPPSQLHPTFGALRQSLDRGASRGAYELRTANRAWGQKGFPFTQEFIRITRDDYGAPLEEADFIQAYEPARQAVNDWVQNQTRDRIKDLFPEGSINNLTRLVLANAIYFKGLWSQPFDPAHTVNSNFSLDRATTVVVPTMIQESKFRTATTTDVKLLELHYMGNDLSLVVVLPRTVDGLAAVEERLTWDDLNGWLAQLAEQNVEVQLPSFKFGSKFSLNSTLAEMGMPSAFQPFVADFSAMDGRRDLHISAAIHQAFVEVNEKGTEAAAATGISMGTTSVKPMFVANHPFLFLIRDHVTGSILFLGRVVDPRA
jgi:serine protease inhibitor